MIDHVVTSGTFSIDGVSITLDQDWSAADDATISTALQAKYDAARGSSDEDYRFAYEDGATPALTITSTTKGTAAGSPVVADVPAPVAPATGFFSGGAASGGTDVMGSDTYDALNTAGMGIDTLDISTSDGATVALNSLDAAITKVSTVRADLGAIQNRFEHTIANVNVAVENLSASESRIRDTDMALEMTQFTRSQILSQAGTAMLAQANSAPQDVLRLLQG